MKNGLVRKDRPKRRDVRKSVSNSQNSDCKIPGTVSEQIIIVMRHGERRDGAFDAVPEVDPPLTEHGIAQIGKTAERLCSMLGPKLVRQLLIMVSPFLRTLQTAEQLQKYGIGTTCPYIVDNTLCEVYGPSRIKSSNPPLLPDKIVKTGCGKLPPWGESIELASRRYVENFQRNSLLYRGKHLLLVTHGDAIGALMSEFYPMRIVYEAEYLSFIVFKRSFSDMCSRAEASFELFLSNGVQWLLEEPEASNTAELAIESENSTGSNARSLTAVERCGETFLGYNYENAGAIPQSEMDNGEEENRRIYKKEDLLNFTSYIDHHTLPSNFSVFLRLATLLSQFLALFVWSSTLNAVMYVTVVVVLELALLGVEKCPAWCPFLSWVLRPRGYFFLNLEENQRVLVDPVNTCSFLVVVLQLIATAMKIILIFALSIALAFFVGLFCSRSIDMMHSLSAGFTTPAGVLIYLLFVVFNMTRRCLGMKYLGVNDEFL